MLLIEVLSSGKTSESCVAARVEGTPGWARDFPPVKTAEGANAPLLLPVSSGSNSAAALQFFVGILLALSITVTSTGVFFESSFSPRSWSTCGKVPTGIAAPPSGPLFSSVTYDKSMA